jgi:hypothetical protein
MGYRESDEAIVVVKRSADEAVGDPAEVKTDRQRNRPRTVPEAKG